LASARASDVDGTTLINALEQRGGRCFLQTMCLAGGMANAIIIERLG
jgi:acetyl-CoA acyltransferase